MTLHSKKVRQLLKSSQILSYPDFTEEFLVTVDSSQFDYGGVLTQIPDGIERPISYISKSYTKGECNNAIIEKELLAINFC